MRTHNLQKPARLYWDIRPKLAGIIENAVRVAQKVNMISDALFSRSTLGSFAPSQKLCQNHCSYL